MYYIIGKQFDTFEAAVGRMIEEETGQWIPQLNCLSGRSFAFRMDEDKRYWFVPRADLKQAAEQLSTSLRITIRYRRIYHAEDITAIPAKCMILYGITRGMSAPEFCSYYYVGNQYLYLWKTDIGTYSISDPRGLPEQRMTAAELDRLLIGNHCEVIYCGRNLERPYIPEKKDILKKGLLYRRYIAKQEETDILKALTKYTRRKTEWLSLQYGLMNLMQHFDGVFQLKKECGQITEQVEQIYINRKYALFQQGKKQRVQQISQTIKTIWRLMEHGLEGELDEACAFTRTAEHTVLSVPCGKSEGSYLYTANKAREFHTDCICSQGKSVAHQQSCRFG